VKGDLSLVGPRPELPEIVAHYEELQHQRHVVKPGLTGLWQVSIPYGKPMAESTDLDLEYIEKLSLWSDFLILMRTPAAMFRWRGRPTNARRRPSLVKLILRLGILCLVLAAVASLVLLFGA